MSTWKLFLLGREVLRTEHTADGDKTLTEALTELMGDDDLDEEPEEVDIGLRMNSGEHVVWDGVIED